MEGGKEMNYWPGFVDALANVVVTMIFVIVVFTIALLYFSQNKVKEVLAAAEQAKAEARAEAKAQAPPAPPSVAALEKRLAELARENEQLRRQMQAKPAPQAGSVERGEVKITESAPVAGAAPASVRIRGTRSAVEVVFPAGAIDLDKASLGRLETSFAAFAERARAGGVELVGVAEVGPYSEGRRLSYYRNLALRNWLIEKGVPASQIRMRIADVDSGQPEGLVRLSAVQPE
jgi:outer membrane protein OmpA-like peptidoglycan-associated protein